MLTRFLAFESAFCQIWGKMPVSITRYTLTYWTATLETQKWPQQHWRLCLLMAQSYSLRISRQLALAQLPATTLSWQRCCPTQLMAAPLLSRQRRCPVAPTQLLKRLQDPPCPQALRAATLTRPTQAQMWSQQRMLKTLEELMTSHPSAEAPPPSPSMAGRWQRPCFF